MWRSVDMVLDAQSDTNGDVMDIRFTILTMDTIGNDDLS